jgi:GT2 family glycosyltransferase
VAEKLAIIILNWNGKRLLEQFLPSVVTYSQEALVYVVDNASTDNSVAYVKQNFPTVNIIQNKENGGYAKGYNNALQQVDADIFCLLNSDVEVTPNWLAPIIEAFELDTKTAILQPKLLDYKRKDYFEYAGAAGGFIDKYGYPYCRGRIFNTIEKDNNQYENSDIFWASGACIFIRKSVFDILHGFDESFFAHMEEIDLCWRAHNLGYTTKYVADSIVYHVGGATLNATNPKKTFLNFRNSLFILMKNAGGNIVGILFVRMILDGLAALKFLIALKPSHFVAIMKAHFSFYENLPSLLRKRKELIQSKNYYKVSSIIWSYFIKKRKQFDCL